MKRLRKLLGTLVVVCMASAMALPLAGCGSGEEYTPQLGEPKLSSPAIGQNGTLRVGVNTNNSPLAGKSGDKIIGIDVDIAAALADELGLHVEIVDVGGDASGAIDDGKVDIALGIDSTSTQPGYWTSSQYLPTGVALFELESSNKTTPTAESKPKVAAQVSSKSAWAVNNVFGEESLESATDLPTAFEDLKSGKVEYVASDAIIGLYAASRAGVDVKIVALLDTASGYCAMAAESNTDLQNAVEDALTLIAQNGVVGVIEDKWLGQTVDLSSLPKIEGSRAARTNASGAEDAGEGEGAAGSSSSSSASTAGGSGASSSSSAASAA